MGRGVLYSGAEEYRVIGFRIAPGLKRKIAEHCRLTEWRGRAISTTEVFDGADPRP